MLTVVLMVTFALSQSVWEFAKLRAIRARRASVVYMPRAKCASTSQFYLPTCQSCANYSIFPAKGFTNFSNIFQIISSVFEFFNYAQHFKVSRIFG